MMLLRMFCGVQQDVRRKNEIRKATAFQAATFHDNFNEFQHD